MKILKPTETNKFSNSDTCVAYEYPFEDKDLNIARVVVNGRYPKTGHLVNEVCKEIAYVISGTGKVGVEDNEHALATGDAVLINPGEKFFWQGEDLVMLMPCSPAFYPEQHKEVE